MQTIDATLGCELTESNGVLRLRPRVLIYVIFTIDKENIHVVLICKK